MTSQVGDRVANVLTSLLGFAIFSGSVVTAQTFFRDGMSISGNYTMDDGSGSTIYAGNVFVGPNFGDDPSDLLWEFKDPVTGQVATHSIALPFNRSGGVASVTPDSFLISGLNVSQSTGIRNGIVAKLRLVRNGLVLSHVFDEVQTYPNIDPVSCHYNKEDGHIYLWDADGERIVAAQWSGWSAPIPDEASFSTALAKTASPTEMRHFHLTELFASDSQDWGHVPTNSVSPWPQPVLDGFTLFDPVTRNMTQYRKGASWFSFVTSTDYFAKSVNRFEINPNPPDVIGGSKPFTVRSIGLDSVAYQILDYETGAVVHDGLTVAGVDVVGPIQLFNSDPGRGYRIKATSHGDFVSGEFLSSLRYGVSQPALDFTFSEGVMPYWGPQTDQDAMGIPWGVGVFVDERPASGQLLCTLLIGVRTPSQDDPVTINGNLALLSPTVDISFVMDMSDIRSDISNRINFFDNDIYAEGTVLLFQYIFVSPGGVGFSDVFGRKIRRFQQAHAAIVTPQTPAQQYAHVTQQLKSAYGAVLSSAGRAARAQALAIVRGN